MSDIYKKVFTNNEAWVESVKKDNPDFFENLSKGQQPPFLFIGCADSRVPVAQVMGLKPGDVFVHRNIANVVEYSDLNVQSVIEYAVAHLKVKHIVVCGHYGCGGVQASMSPQDLGPLNGWLESIRNVYRIHRDTLDAIADSDARAKRLVELNVQEQCLNVMKTAVVQKHMAQENGPTVHGWVYDLASGRLNDLDINTADTYAATSPIYNLA